MHENNKNNYETYTKDDGYKNHDRVMFWISNGDTKISFALAFIGVIASVAFANDKIGLFINKHFDVLQNMTIKDLKVIYSILCLGVLVAFCAFIIRSIYFLFKGLLASTNTKIYNQDGLETNSKLFWGTVTKSSYLDFKKAISNMTEEEMINDMNSQTYIKSIICTKKFKNYNKGLKSLQIALFIFVILIVITNI